MRGGAQAPSCSRQSPGMLPAHGCGAAAAPSLPMLPHPCPSQPGPHPAACGEGPRTHRVLRPPRCHSRAKPVLVLGGGGVSGGLPQAGESRGRRRGLPRRQASRTPGCRKTWQCPQGPKAVGARGEEPTRLLLRRSWGGPRGAHRILTRRPRVSATFTRTAGTGSFRSRFRAGRSRAQTCRGGLRDHGHPPPPAASWLCSIAQGRRNSSPRDAGPPRQPRHTPQGGNRRPKSSSAPPQEPPSSAEPRGPTPRQRDGATEAAGSAWSWGGGGPGRGLWGAGLEPVGLLLHRPGEEKGPQHGGPGPGRGTEPGAEPPGARGAVQTLAGPSLPYQHDFLMPGTAPGSKKTIQVVFPSSKSIIIFFQ